jgi:transposase
MLCYSLLRINVLLTENVITCMALQKHVYGSTLQRQLRCLYLKQRGHGAIEGRFAQVKHQKKTAKTLDWAMQPIGRPKVITDEYLAYLKNLVKQSPQVYGYPFKRWTAGWLRCHLAKELGIEVSDRHINRLLNQMGLSTRKNPANPEQSDGSPRRSQILIQDLNPSAVPEFNWPFIERRRA